MENIGFAGINYQWFIGQVPPNQTLDKTDPDGWGDRVKVRIVGMHNKFGTITPDEQLPWAIVERPTTQGNASRGSTGLTGGEWVRGYFLDPFNQVPVITAVLGRGTYENNASLQIVKERKSTEFENITRFNSFAPYSGQMRGGDKPTTPAQPTKQEFNDVKDSTANPQLSGATPTGVPSEPKITTNPDGSVSVTTYTYDPGVEGGVVGFTRQSAPGGFGADSVIDIGKREQSQNFKNELSRLTPSGISEFNTSKLSSSTQVARDYTPRDRAEDKLLLRSIQKGELGPIPRDQIDAIINRINGVQVRGA